METKTIGVLGSGIMGGGIGQMFAENGFDVLLWDVSPEILAKGLDNITKRLRKSVEKGVMDAAAFEAVTGRLKAAESLELMRSADFIIEAVLEDFSAKEDLYRRLEAVIPPTAIVGSNTSSLSVEALAKCWASPGRFMGVHFFNPPTKLELVELVRTSKVSDESVKAVKAVRELLDGCGKTAVDVKDSPGFIVNRLLLPMINEAAKLVGEGVASIPDIDTAMCLGALHPAGPLKVADLVGLDVCQKILDGMAVSLSNPAMKTAGAIADRVAAGKLGRKSGEGFYKY